MLIVQKVAVHTHAKKNKTFFKILLIFRFYSDILSNKADHFGVESWGGLTLSMPSIDLHNRFAWEGQPRTVAWESVLQGH